MRLKIKYQHGVSLIESMIALLVISVGLLGIAALQLTAMGQNSSALNHSQAVWIAYNIADRIRANNKQINPATGNFTATSPFNLYANIDTKKPYSQQCLSQACLPSEMVTADATEWATMMSALPNGRGMITNTANGLLVTIMWDDEGTGATGINCGNNPEVDLTCYSVELLP